MKIETAIQSNKMELTTKTVINVLYTSRVIEERITELLKNFDLTTQQFNVLRILRGQQGNPANLSNIQERMIDRNSNTTRLVDKLITKGLVRRNICKQNRRKVEIFITENGLQVLQKLDPLVEQNNQKFLKGISVKEQIILNRLLDTLREI